MLTKRAMRTPANESLRRGHPDRNPGRATLPTRSGSPIYPIAKRSIPVIVIEIIRGRLNLIRQAEAGKTHVTLEQAHQLFERTIVDVSQVKLLPFTDQAETLGRKKSED